MRSATAIPSANDTWASWNGVAATSPRAQIPRTLVWSCPSTLTNPRSTSTPTPSSPRPSWPRCSPSAQATSRSACAPPRAVPPPPRRVVGDALLGVPGEGRLRLQEPPPRGLPPLREGRLPLGPGEAQGRPLPAQEGAGGLREPGRRRRPEPALLRRDRHPHAQDPHGAGDLPGGGHPRDRPHLRRAVREGPAGVRAELGRRGRRRPARSA